MFGSSRREVVLRSFRIQADRAAAPTLSSFNFNDFPIEIAARILVLATATSTYWRTYKSLILVSHEMQALVYDTCFPHLPIMLHTERQFNSFCELLASHPTTVGPRIRSVWFIAGIKADVERTLGHSILQKCTRITHMACKSNLLGTFVRSSRAFKHHDLKHLTLLEPIVPWEGLLRQPAGRQLFAQLTHLRTSGGTTFAIPNFCFASLTHLSFTCHKLVFGSTTASPFDAKRFPVLQQVVPSIPYMVWRLQDPKTLRMAGLAVDGRIDVIACPKKWKEADMWEGVKRGKKDLWKCARSEEYLQRSRAFTTEPPLWDHSDSDHCTYRFDGGLDWDSDF